MKRNLIVILLTLCGCSLFAQDNQMQEVSFKDMTAFKEQAGNWFVVGDVVMNPTIDIHHEPKAEVEEVTGKKKKKRKKTNNETPKPEPKAVTFETGTGVLLNMNDETIKDHLLTQWEHGDIILETDVMIPKGSNSGIYLQGRYEVQLLDSWGVKSASFSDIGGIYRNWEQEPGKIYMGKAPFTNAAFAPGVWQHMKIAFRAPRFDGNGKKVENARFIYVELNGIRIHENLEVPLPTGGPVENNETAKGPLMIQGDHGPVAFRNMQYQLMESADIALTDISYKAFHGKFDKIEDFESTTPVKTGEIPELTYTVSEKEDNFAVILNGNIQAPKAGNYKIRINYVGGLQFMVADKMLINQQVPNGNGNKLFTVNLKEGKQPFKITYYKSIGWRSAMLGVFEANSFPRPLHNFSSFSAGTPNYSPIYVDAENTPRLLRAFLDFEGDKSKRLTHTIGVADPSGVHYIYDLKTATPVCVWRGEFVDATPMWNNRGDGSFRPRGAARYLFTGLSVANLRIVDDSFPEKMDETKRFHNKGYKIDENTGRPVFVYSLEGFQLEDMIYPEDDGKSLARSFKVAEGTPSPTLFVKLAEGENIFMLETGEYCVDKKYFIQLKGEQGVSVRNINGKQELIARFLTNSIDYKIIW
ncbi:MAG: family 16 glycoside hydrolase [Bacteroidota bacterium]